MGLDLAVLKTRKDVNLEHIYSIRHVIEEGYNWLLTGETQKERNEKFAELCEFAKSLTKEKIVNRVAEKDKREYNDKYFKYLVSIPDGEFDLDLRYIIKSIGRNCEGNSHLFFEWEKLPGKPIVESCSWELQGLFSACQMPDNGKAPGVGDSLVELNKARIRVAAKQWKKYGTRLKLTKWIGFFRPDAAERMMEDFHEMYGTPLWGINDLLYYRRELLKTFNEVDCNSRLWLVSSY